MKGIVQTFGRAAWGHAAYMLMAVASGAALVPAASVRLEWESVGDAVEYVVFTGPATGGYERAEFVRRSAEGYPVGHTVTNLDARRPYRFAVVAYTRENGSEPAELALREEVLWIEEAESLAGPWRVVGSNVLVRSAEGQRWYRGRMEKPR